MISNGSNSVTLKNHQQSQSLSITLLQLTKEDLSRRDVFGRTILHLLIICNRSDLLRHLLRNPEIKTIINKPDYENGWNCLHYIIFLKRIQCYKILLDSLKQLNPNGNSLVLANNTILFELIRCKDRNRNTPLQLLDNDFKSLIWIPEFINDNDKVNLQFRFDIPELKSENPNSSGEGERDQNNVEDSNNSTTNSSQLRQLNKRIRALNDRHNWWDPKRSGSDLFMFGSNLNNTLGLGDSTDRQIPSKLPDTYFKSTNDNDILSMSRFKLVQLSKNHSIVLTKDGSLYSCGIGSRGRLGHEDMNNCYRFKKIEYFEESNDDNRELLLDRRRKAVKDFAISNDHSLALTTDNELYSWGLNKFSQLGYFTSPGSNGISTSKEFSDPFEAVPKLVFSGDLKKNVSHIRGLSLSKIHSLVYTKHEIFSWGLNIGQMGFPSNSSEIIEYKVSGATYKGSIQAQPRMTVLRDEIKLVTTCETCTCVITMNNDIHLYIQGQHLKLPKIPVRGSLDRNFHLFTPVKLTKAASISKICMKSPEHVALLLDSGDMLGFSVAEANINKLSKSVRYTTIWKSHDRDLKVADCDISADGSVVLTTAGGLVFMKHSASGSKVRKNSMSETALPIPVKNKFRRIDYLNKVLRVSCDDNFASFGFIRDDIDLIPLKLSTNTFINDMKYLSVLTNANLYRKQNQLFESSATSTNDKGSYVSSFIYPKKFEETPQDFFESDEEEINVEAEEEEKKKTLKLDTLFNNYINKFDASKNKGCKTRFTYEQIADDALESDKDCLKAFNGEELQHVICNDGKHYDSFIKFKFAPLVSIGFHKSIFMVRSPFCKKLFNSGDDVFVSDDIKGEFDSDTNTLLFESNVNVKSVLILVHFLYTNRILRIWDDYPSGIHCPADIKALKDDFEKLGKLFQVIDVFGTFTKDEKYFRDMRSLCDFDTYDAGDLTVILADGELKCSSAILSARSAYFETTLSHRWNPETHNVLDFSKLDMCQFSLVLRHIYGFSDYSLFNKLKEHCKAKEDFISCLLEIMQISDELLLFQLKDLCQLAICDLISSDNVITLMVHSDDLGAKKVFLNCCWYIYNNLEIILLDQSFLMLPNDILLKLETNIKFFNSCKFKDFVSNKGEVAGDYFTNWMGKKSMTLIPQFLFNLQEFNENFMSDAKGFSSFEPLFDVKLDQVKSSESKRSRKNSRKSLVNYDIKQDILDIRKANMDNLALDRTNESAIDNNDDDFEVVTSNRRRKTKSVGFEVNDSKSPSPVVATKANNLGSLRAPSFFEHNGEADTNTDVVSSKLTKPSRPSIESSVVSGLSPHSNWASKSAGSSILTDKSNIPQHQPVLGTSGSGTSPSEWLTKKTNKLKMGPTVKLSQKERKKLALQYLSNDDPEDQTPEKPASPWGTSGSRNASNGNVNINNQADTSSFPALGTNKKQDNNQVNNQVKKEKRKPNKKQQHQQQPKLNLKPNTDKLIDEDNSFDSGNLTLTDIMLQESLKIEQAEERERQRKTLLEIQQEQEFAKWWEEETARVQKQMKAFEMNNSKSTNSKPRRNRRKLSEPANKTKVRSDRS